MKYARALALLSTLGCAPMLHAAEFEDGLIPADLVREFVGGTILSGLPDGFPVPEMPRDSGLSVLGSLDRGPVGQQVVLHNSGTWEAARAILRTAYQATGWLDIGPSDSPAGITGASSRLSLCHDELGFIDFLRTGTDRIRANRNALPPSTRLGALTCSQLKAQGGGSSNLLGFAMELMPVLELPEGAVAGGFPGMALSGISGASIGGNGMAFRIDRDGSIQVPDSSVTALYEHFGAQMEAQGWTLDSAALGAVSSSSIWTKTAETPEAPGATVEELELTGILSILHVEGERYDVLLRLISHGDESAPLPDLISGPPVNMPELGIRGIPPSSGQAGFISNGPHYLPLP